MRIFEMPTPMQRTLKEMRDRGYLAEKVEQRLPIPGKFVTRDFLNFIDIIAVLPDGAISNGITEAGRIVGVQTTSGTNHANHRDKILAEPKYQAWKQAGGLVLLMSWAKRGPRGKRKLWEAREEWL